MIKKEQNNSDFVFRIVTSSLNNSPYLQHELEFLVEYFEEWLHELETDKGRPESVLL